MTKVISVESIDVVFCVLFALTVLIFLKKVLRCLKNLCRRHNAKSSVSPVINILSPMDNFEKIPLLQLGIIWM